ncbi:hypothetical protein KP79_PYT23370 [Mizuhopecten yessoensis]|uniref:Uncharacterized protein n=1 Tax=Mizuhopecten yessoensis TaxID=6573 RepID=A0A210QKN2_MIZYE|nr:hypothetical protein KP79_PYT23370 [Mizuhopecten yessoensis]
MTFFARSEVESDLHSQKASRKEWQKKQKNPCVDEGHRGKSRMLDPNETITTLNEHDCDVINPLF